jgi:hypothetical protein
MAHCFAQKTAAALAAAVLRNSYEM